MAVQALPGHGLNISAKVKQSNSLYSENQHGWPTVQEMFQFMTLSTTKALP